jgi:hypothetical protein
VRTYTFCFLFYALSAQVAHARPDDLRVVERKTLGRAIAGDRSSGRRLGLDCSQLGACRAPPPELLKRLLRRRPGLGGIGHEGQAWMRGQREGFVGEGQVADERVLEPLDAAAVETDVVARPQDAELLAPGRQLADQIREPAVVPVPAGLARRFAPICPEIPRLRPGGDRRRTMQPRVRGPTARRRVGPRARRADGSQLSGSTGTALERRPPECRRTSHARRTWAPSQRSAGTGLPHQADEFPFSRPSTHQRPDTKER